MPGCPRFHTYCLIFWLAVLVARPIRDHVLSANVTRNGSGKIVDVVKGVEEIRCSACTSSQPS